MTFIFLSSCVNKENKYDNTEHFNLENFDDFFIASPYAIVKENGVEEDTHYLLYQVSKDNYVKIEKISSCSHGDKIEKSNSYFYNNHLYTLRCPIHHAEEFVLDETNVQRKDMHLDTSLIDDKELFLDEILNVDKNYIYYKATLNNRKEIDIKCSLNDYKCELYKES